MGSRIESSRNDECKLCAGRECYSDGDGRVKKIRGSINSKITEILFYSPESIEHCPLRQVAIDHQNKKRIFDFKLNSRPDLDISASGFPTNY